MRDYIRPTPRPPWGGHRPLKTEKPDQTPALSGFDFLCNNPIVKHGLRAAADLRHQRLGQSFTLYFRDPLQACRGTPTIGRGGSLTKETSMRYFPMILAAGLLSGGLLAGSGPAHSGMPTLALDRSAVADTLLEKAGYYYRRRYYRPYSYGYRSYRPYYGYGYRRPYYGYGYGRRWRY